MEVPIIEELYDVRPAPISTRIRRFIAKAIGAQTAAALAWTRRAFTQLALSNRYGYTQPVGRRGIGMLVMGLWLTGVGMLAHQQFARTDADRLAEVALVVEPTQYYYEVFDGNSRVGVAMSGIDTTGQQFVSTTLFRVATEPWRSATGTGSGTDHMPSTGSTIGTGNRWERTPDLAPGLTPAAPHRREESMVRTTGFLSRSFVLDSVDVALNGFARRAYTDRYTIPVGVTVLPPSLAPMALVLVHGTQVGTEASYGFINPVRGTTSRATLRVVAESLFTIADSARYDSTATSWVAAHSDTVRAWRVIRPLSTNAGSTMAAGRAERAIALTHGAPVGSAASIPLSLFDCSTGAAVWVDVHGRVVAAEDGAGHRVVRTTYEIAFGNWRHRLR